MKSTITPAILEEAQKYRIAGHSWIAIGKKLKRSESNLRAAFKRAGLPMGEAPHPPKLFTDEVLARVKKLHAEGKKTSEIAKLIGSSKEGLYRVMAKHGLSTSRALALAPNATLTNRQRGQLNEQRLGMTMKEWVAKQPASMSIDDLIASAAALGVTVTRPHLYQCRRDAGMRIRKPRSDSNTTRADLSRVNHALKVTAVATKSQDKIIKRLVQQAALALGQTNIHRLTIDIRSREYRMAYEHEEKGNF